MTAPEDLPEYLDEVHQDIAEFAGRHLDEDEREDFIDQLLERKGYQRVSRWAMPEEGGGQGGGKKPLVRNRPQGSGQRRSGSYFGGKNR